MDKELLRIVIIATGLIIVTGIVIWAYIKNSKHRDSLEEAEKQANQKTFRKQTPALDDDFSGTFDDDLDEVDFGGSDLYASAPNKSSRFQAAEARKTLDEDEDFEPEARFIAPTIIQFSLMANQDAGFNGLDLAHAFNIVGLEYGNLKIYERLDVNRLVDFGVASMVPPGTFPDRNLEEFFCPGLVFFMQPGELDDPVPVFEDFVQTISFMATELDGTILDHQQKPLTETTIDLIRRSL
ncbi:MAG TPA: cell division protein ZipA C-terminal FtsZ-binding domain-containing protein [Methylomicrobium sp.]|nr:cell division protein ZipA C-terminal FtsZ-binding domain-containing protein [Methylomicrobium sp.]